MEWVIRPAKLLEVGIYADKGVVITEEHLERLVAHFSAPVPVYVEHRPSALLLGWVVRLWQEGNGLYGQVALFPEADALLRRLRVRGLSVGLSRDLARLLEVSVTGAPRVASAQLFRVNASERFEEVVWMETPNLESMWEARVRELESQLRAYEVREQVQRWVLSGRLGPAQVPFAEAILTYGESPVQMSGETFSIAELFRRFVESLPPRALLGEVAPVPEEESPAFSAEEWAFLKRAFPDLNPAEVLSHRKEVR